MAADPQGQGMRRRRGTPSNVYETPTHYIEQGTALDAMGRPIKGKTIHRIVEEDSKGFRVLSEHTDQDEAQQAFQRLKQGGM